MAMARRHQVLVEKQETGQNCDVTELINCLQSSIIHRFTRFFLCMQVFRFFFNVDHQHVFSGPPVDSQALANCLQSPIIHRFTRFFLCLQVFRFCFNGRVRVHQIPKYQQFVSSTSWIIWQRASLILFRSQCNTLVILCGWRRNRVFFVGSEIQFCR